MLDEDFVSRHESIITRYITIQNLYSKVEPIVRKVVKNHHALYQKIESDNLLEKEVGCLNLCLKIIVGCHLWQPLLRRPFLKVHPLPTAADSVHHSNSLPFRIHFASLHFITAY